MTRRVDIKAILADPEQRKRLMVDWLMATQAREGIETTQEQAEAAYEKVRVEVEFVTRRAAEVRAEHPDMDPDFTARQIVDDAWRAGIDIRFKQHLIEAGLREGLW